MSGAGPALQLLPMEPIMRGELRLVPTPLMGSEWANSREALH